MQRALTTTLLNLGNFLHELRNVQTAVRMNLEFLDRDQLARASKDRRQRRPAGRAQRAGPARRNLEELRRQAQPREGTVLVVGDVLARALRGPSQRLEHRLP